MSGFTPLFGGGASRGGGAEGGGERPASGGFQPLLGGTGRPGFQSLHAALGQPGPTASPEAAAGPVDLDVALDEARAAGAEEARAALQAELDEMQARLAALEPALDEVRRIRAEALRQAASDVGRLVLGLTRRVLGDSLALHPEALPTMVEQALAQLPDEDELTIRVSPDDVARVRDQLDDRFEDAVVGDPAVSGGCRIEARHAAIDATVDAALEGVEAAVRTWVESRG